MILEKHHNSKNVQKIEKILATGELKAKIDITAHYLEQCLLESQIQRLKKH